jgi:ATP-binding cassette subfamily A (ABC1) protein 3
MDKALIFFLLSNKSYLVAFLQGVKKPPWYFLSPSYWGLSKASVVDKIQKIEESTDEDVLAEEAAAQSRLNQPMSATSAIEIRGLRATFTRGGKAFHAVKCPWYSVEKRQLFALLGPNGAGKTTTINMLTGFLPPTDGNA